MTNPESQNEIFTCRTCGHQWFRGQSGAHSCTPLLILALAAERQRSAELDAIKTLMRSEHFEGAPADIIRAIFTTNRSMSQEIESLKLRSAELEQELKVERTRNGELYDLANVAQSRSAELERLSNHWCDMHTVALSRSAELERERDAWMNRAGEHDNRALLNFRRATEAEAKLAELRSTLHEIFLAANLQPPTEGAYEPVVAEWIRKQVAALSESEQRCEELDRQVTLNRNNWMIDSEEKDRRHYKDASECEALSMRLEELRKALEMIKDRCEENAQISNMACDEIKYGELADIAIAALSQLPKEAKP